MLITEHCRREDHERCDNERCGCPCHKPKELKLPPGHTWSR